MLEYLDHRNEDPEPFIWKADADSILGKVERLCKRASRAGPWCPEERFPISFGTCSAPPAPVLIRAHGRAQACFSVK